jgi:hypothetical protein
MSKTLLYMRAEHCTMCKYITHNSYLKENNITYRRCSVCLQTFIHVEKVKQPSKVKQLINNLWIDLPGRVVLIGLGLLMILFSLVMGVLVRQIWLTH